MQIALVIAPLTAIRRSLVQQLSNRNYVTFEARSGIEGVRLAIKEQPKLVFIDINQPDMSGLETLQQIRIKDNDAHIIMLGSDENDTAVKRALSLNASFFKTPMDFSQLDAVIKNKPASISDEGSENTHLNIMIIMRLANMRFTIKKALNEYAAEITELESGTDAFTNLHMRNYTALFYQEDNPYMPIEDFLEKFNALNKKTIIIAVGQNLQPNRLHQLSMLGVSHFLTTPFTADAVKTIMHKIRDVTAK